MFKTGVKYWFKIRGNNKEVNIKGEVLEENNFLVRIKRDDGSEDIISLQQVLNVNEAKEDNLEVNSFG